MLKAYVFTQTKIGAFKDHLRDLREDNSGAAMIEYALLVGLVAVGAIAAITALTTALNGRVNSIAGRLTPV